MRWDARHRCDCGETGGSGDGGSGSGSGVGGGAVGEGEKDGGGGDVWSVRDVSSVGAGRQTVLLGAVRRDRAATGGGAGCGVEGRGGGEEGAGGGLFSPVARGPLRPPESAPIAARCGSPPPADRPPTISSPPAHHPAPLVRCGGTGGRLWSPRPPCFLLLLLLFLSSFRSVLLEAERASKCDLVCLNLVSTCVG
ncbi:Protein of unknown function [Gryllus bimaculatus]|nr:Protein of unknown function [Gryllus bimaculatus]